MPKFKINDRIVYNGVSPRTEYYKVTALGDTSYVVDVYDMSTDMIKRTNCFGSYTSVDSSFKLYSISESTQIRRP